MATCPVCRGVGRVAVNTRVAVSVMPCDICVGSGTVMPEELSAAD